MDAPSILALVLGSDVVLAIVTWLTGLFNKRKSKSDEILADLKSLSDKLDAHIASDNERHAVQCRSRILRFGDELLHDVRHTKEHFDQTLIDITEYDEYCKLNPSFSNNITRSATKLIQETYDDCLKNGSFL